MAHHRSLPVLAKAYAPMTPVVQLVAVPAFTIHLNSDGSFDAVCAKCLSAAGTAFWQSELLAIEGAHKCEPSLLVDMIHHCWTC